MTAIVAFPPDRVVRTPAQVLEHKELWVDDPIVARLVDMLTNDPRCAHIRAMLEARCERSEGQPS